jgi:Kef-type K+ transport system membrane component KefB
LAAVAVTGLIGFLLSLRAILWRERRRVLAERVRQSGTRGALIAALLGVSASLAGVFVDRGGSGSHPFWAYVLYWVVFGGTPLALGYFLLERWARRTRADEWRAVMQGTVDFSQLSTPLRRAYLAAAVSVALPLGIAAWFLFVRG